MQSCGTLDATPKATPFLLRLTSKLVLEVLPASLASMIGAMLLAHYHLTQPALPAAATPAAAAPASASPAMVRLVRDEHDQIRDFLIAQQAAETSYHAAADAQSAQAAAEAKVAAATATPARLAATVATAEPPVARVKTVAVAALSPAPPPGVASPAQGSPAPLAIAGPQDNAAPPAAPAPSSLVATTLAVKDHMVSATWHAVSVIGGIPSWIGHRFGGDDADAGERQFSAAS